VSVLLRLTYLTAQDIRLKSTESKDFVKVSNCSKDYPTYPGAEITRLWSIVEITMPM
jgi:hypothetical protein